jgi:hypothetical protein
VVSAQLVLRHFPQTTNAQTLRVPNAAATSSAERQAWSFWRLHGDAEHRRARAPRRLGPRKVVGRLLLLSSQRPIPPRPRRTTAWRGVPPNWAEPSRCGFRRLSLQVGAIDGSWPACRSPVANAFPAEGSCGLGAGGPLIRRQGKGAIPRAWLTEAIATAGGPPGTRSCPGTRCSPLPAGRPAKNEYGRSSRQRFVTGSIRPV